MKTCKRIKAKGINRTSIEDVIHVTCKHKNIYIFNLISNQGNKTKNHKKCNIVLFESKLIIGQYEEQQVVSPTAAKTVNWYYFPLLNHFVMA